MKAFLRNFLVRALLIALISGTLYGLCGADVLPPNGYLFPFIALFVSASMAGRVAAQLRLPPLLGMLIVGVIIRNERSLSFDQRLSSNLRSFALTIILLRAGLSLDMKILKRLGCAVAKLSLIPCLIEAISVAISGHFLLKLPLSWSCLLGCVITALSSAVIVPAMLDLEERGHGVDQGIPTLLIAATSLDNVVAISAFGIAINFVFPHSSASNSSNLWWTVLKGPLEVLIGVVFGVVCGVIIKSIPRSSTERLISLIAMGTCAIFGSKAIQVASAGPIASLMGSFIAGRGWRASSSTNCDSDLLNPVAINLKEIWLLSEPFLFGLIGAEVDLTLLNWTTIGLASAVIISGLIARLMTTGWASFGSGFTNREKLFMMLAFLSKATVQAAFGPVALDMAREQQLTLSTQFAETAINATTDSNDAIGYATDVLNVAVMSILITAPLGALAIALTGHRLLTKSVAISAREDNAL